ncbi:MAG: hypothetical protein GKR91_14550 [Pseudomonadales bacterium]|nr:hypothetical protein [Pseudomonadales bacterium]
MTELVSFMIVSGLAVIVSVIVIIDVFKKNRTAKPFLKWALVALLTLAQLWWWQAIDNFDGAFGNSPAWEAEIFVFSSIVVIWFAFQIVGFLRTKPGARKSK